ncbi:hypothetical protein EVJ58_g5008 [Rhodofomes roseus]|uniref:Uncharacterized protein n=1 Tax=Rhodofomes roseus TaxID=34475 RepID=A0A4Y9YF97_9APHY|nr:hypothetical protein EVJ58_g5008 [Rhodofomes roseus]
MLTLNRAGLDDTTLHQLVAELPKRCIALIEDIDAVFRQDVSCRPSEEEPKEGQYGGTGQEKKEEAHCRVSLSGLLNALDGIAAQEGRILFATTNHYRALDPALCRPGRMDLHLEFKLASKDQAARLFYRFYSDTRDDGDDEALYHGEDDLGTHTLQGVAPLSPPPTPPPAEAMSAVDDAGTSSTRDSEDPGTETDLRQLAARFADPIPEGRFSMADLQGYLMLYKDKPEEGVEAVEKWVKGQNAATMNA